MKSYTPKEIIDFLLKNGFELITAKGSHQILKNPQTGMRTVVPMHNKDLKKRPLYGILKQAGIDADKLS